MPNKINSDIVVSRTSLNPKDQAGMKKVAPHLVPPNVITSIALALEEGAIKYSAYNFRSTSIQYTSYYDAVMRHMFQWYNGEDIDKPSGLPHVVKAMATLAVLVDAMHNNKVIDDRPVAISNPSWMDDMNAAHVDLVERVTKAKEATC